MHVMFVTEHSATINQSINQHGKNNINRSSSFEI